jgi:multiple sugar transport system permease protein
MPCLAGLLPDPALSPLFPIWIVNLLATVVVTVFLLGRALQGIPMDLEDAARIDGCGFWGLCRHVMAPLVLPTLGFLGLFILIAACDDALAPAIEASTQPPASPGLYALQTSAVGARIGLGTLGLLMSASLLLIPAVVAIILFAMHYLRKAEPPAEIKR